MNAVLLIGRILFAVLFLSSGFAHFAKVEAMAGFAAYKKVPLAKFSVLFSGAMEVVGALAVIFGVYADLGALLLAIFVIPTALLMHNFWTIEDPMAKQGEMSSFMKNIALGGAALILFVLIARGAEIGSALGHPAFTIR